MLRPFRALSFDPHVTGPLDAVVAPAGGGLSRGEREALYARSPYNVVRIEDGRDEPGDTVDVNRYARARRQLLEWRKAGVLREDADDTYYLYEQEHVREGRTLLRLLLVALVPLHAAPEIAVGPPAGAPEAPRDDRFRLLSTCHVQVQTPLHLLEDADGAFYDVLDRMQYDADDQRAEIRSADGVLHRFKAVHGGKYAPLLEAATAGRRRFLVDGHVQMEAARRFRDHVFQTQPDVGPDSPESFALAAFVSTADPGLRLQPMSVPELLASPGPWPGAVPAAAPPALLGGLLLRRIEGL